MNPSCENLESGQKVLTPHASCPDPLWVLQSQGKAGKPVIERISHICFGERREMFKQSDFNTGIYGGPLVRTRG